MKITDIRTLICHAYRCNWVFVIVGVEVQAFPSDVDG